MFGVESGGLVLRQVTHLDLGDFEAVSVDSLQNVSLESDGVWFDYCEGPETIHLLQCLCILPILFLVNFRVGNKKHECFKTCFETRQNFMF